MVLRVGVVGCGNISDIYIRNALRFPGMAVTACASRRIESARAKAALGWAPMFPTYREGLADCLQAAASI